MNEIIQKILNLGELGRHHCRQDSRISDLENDRDELEQEVEHLTIMVKAAFLLLGEKYSDKEIIDAKDKATLIYTLMKK